MASIGRKNACRNSLSTVHVFKLGAKHLLGNQLASAVFTLSIFKRNTAVDAEAPLEF